MAESPSATPMRPVSDFSASMTGQQSFRLLERRQPDRNIRYTVLFFYPKDNTPGCTTENLAFRDTYEQFQELGVEIFGISRDTLRSHESFKAKLDLPFELIADTDEAVCLQFGVIKQKMMYGKLARGIERSTFLIDADGKLVKEWRGVRASSHVDEVLEFLSS